MRSFQMESPFRDGTGSTFAVCERLEFSRASQDTPVASEDLEVVRTALIGRHVVAIELAEVELVDREAVMLLAQAEAEGIELRSCPTYIREWITKERASS